MASGLAPKIRLVKCPKCRKLLPELEDVPVYQCGGCNTILQAKNRKVNANVASSSQEIDTGQTSESRTASEHKVCSGSSRDTVLHSSVECSLDQETGKCHNESVESIPEKPIDVKLIDGEQTYENQQYRTLVSSRVSSSHELARNENEETLRLAGEKSKVEANIETVALALDGVNETGSNLRSLSSEDQSVAARESTSSITAAQETEIFSSDGLVTSPDEQNQHQKHGFHEGNQGVSTDTIQRGVFLANKNSFAYDGSESSYDERDDQFPKRHMHPSENPRLHVPDERLRNGKFPMNSTMDSDLEIHEQARTSYSELSHNKHSGTRYSKWDRKQLLELSGEDPPIRNWRRYGTDEYQSQMPFHQRVTSFSGAYSERGSASDPSYDEFHGHSRLYSLERPPQYGGGVPSGVNWKEKHIPRYYNHKTPDQIYNDMSYDRHTRGIGQGSGWGQKSKFSRIPFPEETMDRRYQRGDSCFCSGQLPLPVFHGSHLGQDYHNSRNSCPASPHRRLDSDNYPRWSREIVSDVDDHHSHSRGYEVKKHLRERRHVGKSHLRPTAGGAPFVICYNCLETLQLPVDFLIFKRVFHFLKCGACSNVLRFSLQDGTHLVPAAPDPQPSEDRDTNNNDSPNGNPMSCFNGVADRRNVSYDSSSTMGDRPRLHTKESRDKYDNTRETSELGSSSSKESKSETTLHRLMGYSTVSQVFKASGRPPPVARSDHVP